MKYKGTLEQINNQIVKFDFKYISNSFYYKKYLKIGTIDKQRQLFLVITNKHQLETIEQNYLNLAYALKKLAMYVLKTEDKKLLKQLHLKDLDIQAIKKRNLKILFNYARIDSVFDGNTFKILEFNSRRAQMFEDTDWINSKISNSIKGIKREENIKEIVKSIKTQLALNRRNLSNIILISDFDKKGKFSFNNELIQQFNKSTITRIGYNKMFKFYKNLVETDNGLYYKNKKIDAFVVQSLGKGKKSFFNSQGGINNIKIKNAYKNKLIEISSPPSCMLFGRKQALKVIQNPEIQKLIKLNNKELEAVKSCAQNYDITLVEKITNFNKYVLKITGVGQGKGVFIGKSITKKVVKEIKSYIKQNKSKIILQEKITLSPMEIFILETQEIKQAVVQLEPFIVCDRQGKFKICGYSARAVKLENSSTNTKFNPAFNNHDILFGSLVCVNE